MIINDRFAGELPAQNVCDKEKIICLLAGQVFDYKGYGIFNDLFYRTNSDGDDEITIQLRVPCVFGLRSVDKVEVVEMVDGQQPESEYVSRYLTSHVVLMPYLISKYAYSASSVFINAVILGCIPIVPKHTTMASELIKFGLSDLVLDLNTDFSWRLITSVARDAVIRDKFDRMRRAYRKRFCLPLFSAEVSKIIFLALGRSRSNY